jgi:hypothetical protein
MGVLHLDLREVLARVKAAGWPITETRHGVLVFCPDGHPAFTHRAHRSTDPNSVKNFQAELEQHGLAAAEADGRAAADQRKHDRLAADRAAQARRAEQLAAAAARKAAAQLEVADPGQVLATRRETSPRQLAAACRLLWLHRHQPGGVWRPGQVTARQVLDVLEAYPEVRGAVRRAGAAQRAGSPLVAAGYAAAGALIEHAWSGYQSRTGDFAQGLERPGELPPGDPRRALLAAARPRPRRARDHVAFTLLAFNLWILGQSARVLRLSGEAMPDLVEPARRVRVEVPSLAAARS